MRFKEAYIIHRIGDEYMMLSHRNSTIDFTCAIALNASAAYLIGETGDQSFSFEDWVSLLVGRYGIDRIVAETDVQALIEKLIKEKIIDA